MSLSPDLGHVVLRGDLFIIRRANLIRWLRKLRTLTRNGQSRSADEFNIQDYGAVYLGTCTVFNDDNGPELEEIDDLLEALAREPPAP